MPIHQLRMIQFRNHQQSHFQFIPHMNILYGPNGSGKTSVLEAIHCLTVAKSFKTPYDKRLVQHDADYYQLEGQFNFEDDTDTVQLNYVSNQGKKLFINSGEQDKLSAVVGRYPVVTLTPEDSNITFGPPSVRRKYINKVMSQTSAEHMERLIEFQNIIKQRNALLQEYADSDSGKIDETLISVYDEKLIQMSEQIEIARLQFFDRFKTYFQKVYDDLNKDSHSVKIRFSPSVNFETSEQFASDFREALIRRRNQELAFRRTMVGPQSDVIDIYFDGKSLRDYGSQGEHKLILVALKIAEGEYITRERDQSPIYLFDDLFAELDIQRSKKILSAIDSRGQILITSTDLSDIRHHGIDLDGQDIKVFDMSEINADGVVA